LARDDDPVLARLYCPESVVRTDPRLGLERRLRRRRLEAVMVKRVEVVLSDDEREVLACNGKAQIQAFNSYRRPRCGFDLLPTSPFSRFESTFAPCTVQTDR
jgi:hypothetical protein